MEEPHRAKPLRDKDAPKCKKSNTAIADPSLPKDLTDSEEPK
jgi:hypothetical protein